MRFSAIHKATSYLMVAAAFATLALSRELSPLTVGLTLVVRRRSPTSSSPRACALLRARSWAATWNALTLAFFAWTLLDAIRGELLGAGIRFLCFLLVNKLWNRKSSRDYLQAYVVSFLMLVAGAALNSDLAYAGCFLAYVVFATWTLTLFHLRREMEENYLIKHSDDGAERVEVERILNSRRIVGWSFLGATSLVSIGVFVCADARLLPHPALRLRLLRLAPAARQPHRRLLRSRRPRRLRPHQGQPAGDHAHRVPARARCRRSRCTCAASRSTSTSAAAGRAPSTSRRGACATGAATRSTSTAGERLTGPKVRALLDHAVEQRVYLDPLDTSVLFGASMPVAYSLPGNGAGLPGPYALVPHGADEPYAMEHRPSRNFSHDELSRAQERAALQRLVRSRRARSAHPRHRARRRHRRGAGAVHRRAARSAAAHPRAGATDHREEARAVAEGDAPSATTCSATSYTLDLKRDERFEPLEDFLFVQKAGHCEYFASALAVMLRTVGVPTRSVNGFYGGEWNCVRPLPRGAPGRRALVGRGVDRRRRLGDGRSDAARRRGGERRRVEHAAPDARQRRARLVQVRHRVRPRQAGRAGALRRTLGAARHQARLARALRAQARARRRRPRRARAGRCGSSRARGAAGALRPAASAAAPRRCTPTPARSRRSSGAVLRAAPARPAASWPRACRPPAIPPPSRSPRWSSCTTPPASAPPRCRPPSSTASRKPLRRRRHAPNPRAPPEGRSRCLRCGRRIFGAPLTRRLRPITVVDTLTQPRPHA